MLRRCYCTAGAEYGAADAGATEGAEYGAEAGVATDGAEYEADAEAGGTITAGAEYGFDAGAAIAGAEYGVTTTGFVQTLGIPMHEKPCSRVQLPEHPSPVKTLLSSHVSYISIFPLPQTGFGGSVEIHLLGIPVHEKFGSMAQLPEHPSPVTTLLSSHVSYISIFPLPQTGFGGRVEIHVLGIPVHEKFGSIVQEPEHPSPVRTLPSSQVSYISIFPLPQTGFGGSVEIHLLGIPVHEKFGSRKQPAEQPSPDFTLRSSQASYISIIPLPQTGGGGIGIHGADGAGIAIGAYADVHGIV